MGYDIHITRAENWAENEGHQITLAEWHEYVVTDPEIIRDNNNGPTDFLLLAHAEEPWPIWWFDGDIRAKNPPEQVINKMIVVAQKLGARVQGDDGEEYDDFIITISEDTTPSPVELSESSSELGSSAPKKKWWQLW